MTIGIIDLIILILLLIGGIVGFKEGVIKRLTSFIGLFVIIIIAFSLKNKLSIYFYENLPFFDLWGIFKGIQIMNVVVYEVVAFLIILAGLVIIYNILLAATGIIEKVLKATVILSIPSKILGFFVGVVESYVWVYIIIFILTLPIVNFPAINDSEIARMMMDKTPILSKYTDETIDIYNDIYNVIANGKNKTNTELNEETIDLMLKYEMITLESVEKLIKSNKVTVSDEYEEKIEKAKEEEDNDDIYDDIDKEDKIDKEEDKTDKEEDKIDKEEDKTDKENSDIDKDKDKENTDGDKEEDTSNTGGIEVRRMG